MELTQNPRISSDPQTKGFDLSAGNTWIYPENYPVRDYQFNIVEAALHSNTLVCLPTGLGKTFIAAVVMYNFWRWYPCGKVVFLAPTKPLVAQQIFACHDITGIPSAETIELTGAVSQKQREMAWSKKRVVFATPQVFHNDLEKNVAPGNLVKCVVIDEAHKALGKHSYCECIRLLSEKNEYFRVLALSATPGNKIDNVHEVLQNLRIAHLELKDETSPDIIPYINKRKIDIILVPLNSELADYKERYIFIMDRHVKVLLQHNVLRGHTANISKGRVFHILREFQKKTNKSGNYGQIIKTLNILMTMYHAYELMVRDGLRVFYSFYQSHSDKYWMNEERELQNLLEDIRVYLGPFPDVKSLCEETIDDIPRDLVFGHTKFPKLKQLLLHHFTNNQEKQDDTRAIVFVEYRDIVSEIYVLLLQCRPLIRPQMFVGQAGQKQKQQIKALENFRSNHVNVLISTSIGEEGLDVGEVDLIICFDISQHSPTRLVQRMGRTGRKRDGHIIILVTDGREHETLKSTMARRDSINYKILNTSNIFDSLYQNNPRMIPETLKPECLKMHINVQPNCPVTKCNGRTAKSDKRDNKRKNTRKKITTTDSSVDVQPDGAKFSIVKFFKSKKQEEERNALDIPNLDTCQPNNTRNTIKTSDVKVLSCDNDAVDFLTACALRNSNNEMNAERNSSIDQIRYYIPKSSALKTFFNFSVPGVQILDCLTTLNDIVPICRDHEEGDLIDNNKRAGSSDGIDLCNDTYQASNTIAKNIDSKYVAEESRFVDFLDDNKYVTEESRFEDLLDDNKNVTEESRFEDLLDDNKNVTEESRFEDLLDDSSQSNESDGSVTEEDTNRVNNVRQEDTDDLKVMLVNTSGLQDVELGEFEDILNEMSDDSDNNTCVDGSNTVQTRTENIDIRHDTDIKGPIKNFAIDDNVEFNDTSLQETGKVTDPFNLPRHTENSVENCRRKDEANARQSNLYESKNESLLNVTQAIKEIARLNVNSTVARAIDKSEDDIFEDESFSENCSVQQIKDPGKSSIKASNDQMDLDESTRLNCRDSAINSDFNIEEYKWDDYFEMPISPVPDHAVKIHENSEKLSQVESEIEARGRHSYSSHDWISVEKSFSSARKNISGTSLANKLASVKKCWSSTRDCTNRHIEGEEDSASNLFGKKRDRSINLERSYFFEETENDVGGSESAQERRKRVKRSSRKSRKVKNVFIDDEAKASSNDEETESEESSETDHDLEEFVSYTQNVHDTTEVQAHYLQSIRSPIKRHGYLFKEPPPLDPNIEIYSQPVTQINESYMNDSFCVAEDTEEETMPNRVEELSELEEAERELKRRKRKRCEELQDNMRKKTKQNKRRNIINCCSSSEDEMEKLRQQIKNESSF